jgi:hypothetical protein
VTPRLICCLLLGACTPEPPYDYALTWTCLSAEGCERAEELALIDRLNTTGEAFFFNSTRFTYWWNAQWVDSDSVPAGCGLLYGLALFGHELGPSKICHTAGGYETEISIPNANLMTASRWLVEARDSWPW